MAFVLSVGYGMLLEGLQAWLPYRKAEWWDLAANIMGTSLSVVMSLWNASTVER